MSDYKVTKRRIPSVVNGLYRAVNNRRIYNLKNAKRHVNNTYKDFQNEGKYLRDSLKKLRSYSNLAELNGLLKIADRLKVNMSSIEYHCKRMSDHADTMIQSIGRIITKEELRVNVEDLVKSFDVVLFSHPKQILCVQTLRNITVRGFDFGYFNIVIYFNQIATGFGGPYRLYSDSPQMYNSHSHPHVDTSHSLCAGSGKKAISNHFSSGRIADAVEVITQVLMSYKSSDAFSEIHNWTSGYCRSRSPLKVSTFMERVT